MNEKRGKELFFLNFGSKYFMERNGELKEYNRCKIPITIEEEWKEDVKNELLHKIILGGNTTLIWNLFHMDITHEAKIEAFKKITSESDPSNLSVAVKRVRPLFDPDDYNKLMKFLEQ